MSSSAALSKAAFVAAIAFLAYSKKRFAAYAAAVAFLAHTVLLRTKPNLRVAPRPTPSEEEAVASKTGNLPATGFHFTNSRGSVLHVRHVLPPGPDQSTNSIVGSVLLLHGLGAHTNRASYTKTAELLAARGLAVIMYDQEGFGRSDGLEGYVEDTELLVDDATRVLSLLLSPSASAAIAKEAKPNLGLSEAVLRKLSAVPFFIIGQSMGGGVAARLGHRLSNNNNNSDSSKQVGKTPW